MYCPASTIGTIVVLFASLELNDYLEYVNSPVNANKLHNLSSLEKELLFYFQKISEDDKKEIIEIIKIKIHRQK